MVLLDVIKYTNTFIIFVSVTNKLISEMSPPTSSFLFIKKTIFSMLTHGFAFNSEVLVRTKFFGELCLVS